MIIYTNAPAAYDYGYALRTTSPRTAWGKKLDRVLVDETRWGTYQRDRYLSGLYVAITDKDQLDDVTT